MTHCAIFRGDPTRRSNARWLLLIIAVAFLTRMPVFFHSFYSGDEATYSALAVRILDGALPYEGAVDHKPAGLELLYAVIYGLVGHNHLWAVRLALVLTVAVTGFIIGHLAETLHGGRESRLCGLLYVLASAWGVPSDVQAANTELFLNLPLVLAAYHCVAPPRGGFSHTNLRYVAVGALTAVAGVFKYQAALAGLAWVAAAVHEGGMPRRRLGHLLALAVGFVLTSGAYLALLAKAGVWHDFVFWGWGYNLTYVTTLSWTEMAFNALKYTSLMTVFWLPLLLLLDRSRIRESKDFMVMAWLGAMLLAVSIGGRFFPHYFLMALPPVCLLAATPIQATVPRRVRTAMAVGAAFSAVAFAAAWGWYDLKPKLASYDRAYRQVGAYVSSQTAPRDRLFVWGNSPEIYYYADRVMGTRFPFCNYHTGKIWGTPLDDVNAEGTESQIVPRAWEQLLVDLERNPPAAIVDGGAGGLDRFDRHPIGRYPEIARFVAAHYRLDRIVSGVPVYLLSGDGRPGLGFRLVGWTYH